LGQILSAVLDDNHLLLIVGSHGNAERMLNPLTGEISTANTNNPVPLYLVSRSFKKSIPDVKISETGNALGLLADVAPTILDLLKISPPPSMSGSSLLKYLL